MTFSLGGSIKAAEEDAEPILLGMSTALSGPNQYLGLSIYNGMNQFFEKVNSSDGYEGEVGILGRTIELVAIDDFYNPVTTVDNTRELIEQHKVVAMVGNVGTPTFEELWQQHYLDSSISESKKIAIFGAFTGAGQLRTPDKSNYVFNYRASYDQEMKVIVDHIISKTGISPNRIAFLLQGEQSEESNQVEPDAYGAAGFSAAEKALRVGPYFFESSSNLAKSVYTRNQLQTTEAIEQILELQRNKESPEAIIIVGSYQASAYFIKFMHRLLPTTNFYNLSFAGAGELAKVLNADGISDRVYMTQVVPVEKVDPVLALPTDLVEREGFLAAKELVTALRTCHEASEEASLDRLSVRQALVRYFNFGENCLQNEPAKTERNEGNQLSQYVELTQLNKGIWVQTQ